MFLTDEEIQALTQKKRRSAQAKVMNAMGITHKTRPDGSLVVLRFHVEQQLGSRAPAPQKKPVEPNWAALAAINAESAERERARKEAKRKRIEKTNEERARRGLPPLPFD